MHAKAIAGSYQRTACTSVKTMSGLIAAGFITTDSGPILTCRYAVLQAEAQVLRWTTDGTTPSATVGFRLAVGDRVRLTPSELRTIKVIEESSGGYASVQLFSA